MRVHSLARTGEELLRDGNPHDAAAAYDEAHGLAPDDSEIAAARLAVLESLAVTEHGLRFRYIPAGRRLLGSRAGDPDESPVHAVTLRGFWLTDAPVSWADYCRIMGWSPPPRSRPPGDPDQRTRFYIGESGKIRMQYCEDETLRAVDWHAHAGGPDPLFAPPPRSSASGPESYSTKPMVSVGWQDAVELGATLRSAHATYRLPTEAEWETAARGGLVGARYSWGDEPPTPDTCDFDRLHELSIRPTRGLPPNGYGLHGMCGGVWEWTADWYDARYYEACPSDSPTGPRRGKEKVIRGGSWTDPAEVVTVSFRSSRRSRGWRARGWGGQQTPNIGFRLCRVQF